MNPVLLITLMVIMAVMAIMAGVYRWLAWTREVEERLSESLRPVASEAKSRAGISDSFNSRLRRRPMGEKLERKLIASDSRMSVSEFMMMRFGLVLAGFAAGWLIARTPIAGVPLALMGWILPNFYLSYRQNRRSKLFGSQLPDMLTMLVGSLRAGYGLLHAIAVVEKEMPAPIGSEFGRVVKETALGYSVGDALDHLVQRVDNEDLNMIVTAIHIQNEVGGSLADVLETITATIRERIQLKGEVRAMTAQQRITGTILTGLPFVVGTAIMLMNPDYMMVLFQPGWILAVPACAVVMVIIGNFMMRSMTQIDY